MNKEIEIKEIVGVLTSHLKTMIAIKSDFMKLKDYEKAGVFRDYEREIEKRIDFLQGKKNPINDSLPLTEQQVPKLNFSIASKRILESIHKGKEITWTKDLTLKILNNPDRTTSHILSKLGIEINDLKNSLKNLSSKDDILSKDLPLFTLKTLKAIDTSFIEVKLTKEKEVTPFTILLCVLRNENDSTAKILNKHGITYENLFSEIKKISKHNAA